MAIRVIKGVTLYVNRCRCTSANESFIFTNNKSRLLSLVGCGFSIVFEEQSTRLSMLVEIFVPEKGLKNYLAGVFDLHYQLQKLQKGL